MNKLFVMLPCYNEELNIGKLVDEWIDQKDKLIELGYELQIRPIDDCSKDNTKKVILDKCLEYPQNVELIAHETNKNLCGGLNTSISYFLNNGEKEDLMCLMDGDDTHDPKYIVSMIKKMQNNIECVIASRYCVDSNIVGVAKHREFMSDMARFYYSFVLKVPNVKDYTCGYRLYTYNCINRISNKFGVDPIKEKSFACMMELLYKAYITGTHFAEVGFELRYDKKQGESKMNVFETAKNSIFTALRLKKIK